jgi:hypothetical protein
MSQKTRILSELQSGKQPEELAKDLGMRKQTVVAMLELFVHQGLVREIDCSSACGGCIMGSSCSGSGAGREKLYVVDDEPEIDG